MSFSLRLTARNAFSILAARSRGTQAATTQKSHTRSLPRPNIVLLPVSIPSSSLLRCHFSSNGALFCQAQDLYGSLIEKKLVKVQCGSRHYMFSRKGTENNMELVKIQERSRQKSSTMFIERTAAEAILKKLQMYRAVLRDNATLANNTVQTGVDEIATTRTFPSTSDRDAASELFVNDNYHPSRFYHAYLAENPHGKLVYLKQYNYADWQDSRGNRAAILINERDAATFVNSLEDVLGPADDSAVVEEQ